MSPTSSPVDLAAQGKAAPRPGAEAPIAIEVRDLSKAFRIPTHKVDTLKERLTRPFSSRDYRRLQALDGVSFDIREGEFFGIVGRNGSGKSTLLKLLASIYRADAGSIRMAGRLAPFIELGVGFNLELSARENVVLNGVMMGLTPNESRQRLDAILDFAELEDFVDLKLKNYSSGMLVRLAFSVMLQADADIMLIDEVLAVGDAAFQQKCADAFHEMKEAGKTIVLVTHEMATVEAYCDRAMLISDGEIQYLGDPAEVGRRYLRLNFEKAVGQGESLDGVPSGDVVEVADAWLEDGSGNRIVSIEHGKEIPIRVEIDVRRDIPAISVGFVLANADGVGIFQFGVPVEHEDGTTQVRAGDRVRVNAKIENPLAPGRYFLHCGISRTGTSDVLHYVENCIAFVVFGGGTFGAVWLDHEIEAGLADR